MKTKSLPLLLAVLICAAVQEQMNAFETAQKAQIQMQEMGVKMGKAMLGGDKGK